ncbi:alanine--glyoxylate aminotransferase family protein [Telmatocola sphagniphila]|uniref:Alanine--glyoxylate aminotransferase family protein n=1 Tax=Telmatocola sphagniphila TaxID=1123043 RepID=A0A8E6B257_9BACT|nr:alanine--glyoxylate aminotransferase family protein [Telmatocola sphagniphila]QVL30508.1 alanine--glyoxylate aminotransferase family protein [Telmatocola sphagniphila]
MKPRLFTPGPTPVPEETLLELAKPVTYHRTAEQKAALNEVMEDLKYVFQTKNPVIVLTSSGTGGMEAAVSNVLAPGQKAILLTAGRWGERWRGVLKAFGANLVIVEQPYGSAVDPQLLKEALEKNPDTVAVYATLSETSTGVGHDIEAYGKIVAGTKALLCVDSISGLGAMVCKTDEWQIDINVSGSQKALMMPPGLAYVSVSDKAWKVIESNTATRSFYFDLKRYKAKIAENDTPFTPANTLIKAQRLSLKRIRAEGIENLWARHAKMAEATRAAITAMGLKLFAQRPNNALTVIVVPEGIDGSATLKALEKQYGYKLADGQDNLKGQIWRLSHMGWCDPFDVLGALSALELTLLKSGFKLEPGAGVAAFQKKLAS